MITDNEFYAHLNNLERRMEEDAASDKPSARALGMSVGNVWI